MVDIFELMVNETRQSFFQRENLLMSVDIKCFGLISINAVLFAIFVYIFTIDKSDFLCIPSILLVASLFASIASIWPREWDRQDCKATIEKYGELPSGQAATQLAINYATWDEKT